MLFRSHAKLLLFRSPEGLRIVISGNNLTEPQWTEDRDCLWILDVPASSTPNITDSTKEINGNPRTRTTTQFLATPEDDSNDFNNVQNDSPLYRMRGFLVDLMKSSRVFHDIDNRLDRDLMLFISQRIGGLFDGLCKRHPINCSNGINSRGVRCNFRFVYSFPRLLHRGGWQQVTNVVRTLREQEETKQPAFVMKQKWQEEIGRAHV